MNKGMKSHGEEKLFLGIDISNPEVMVDTLLVGMERGISFNAKLLKEWANRSWKATLV